MRRKPREPFTYVLRADREQADPPRFIIRPPTQRAWAEVVDAGAGAQGILFEAVARFVEALENHADAALFGKPNTDTRRSYLDEYLALDVTRELGNAIADTLLTETDRKN